MKESSAEYQRKYRQVHRDKVNEYHRKWREKHPNYCKLYIQNKNEQISNTCIDCGKLIGFKSIRCGSCAQSIRIRPHGDKNPLWKGGRYHTCGYVIAYSPSHQRANENGYVYEHILIWEKWNNKFLPKGWVIHHLNGIKDDNRITNLQALPNKKHSFILEVKSKRIQELEALLKQQGQLC